MKKTITFMCVLVAFLGLPNARGQSIKPNTFNVSGGSGQIGTTYFDWSIGEMALVSTFTGTSVIVTQGVLQNNKSATSIQTPSMGDRVQVFPNPANTIVNLQYIAVTQGTLSYSLYDMLGKTILKHNKEIGQGVTQEQLNISDLAAAVYMMEVSFKDNNGQEERSSFKIEKLK